MNVQMWFRENINSCKKIWRFRKRNTEFDIRQGNINKPIRYLSKHYLAIRN